MFGSIRLGTFRGIPIGMNWSVLVIGWLIAFSLAAQALPVQVPGLPDAAYWVAGLAAAGLFFGSLLAHELSHALVARREGLNVSGITLWLLGGVARMQGDAPSPGAEARISGVGPLTSFGLAIAFAVATAALGVAPSSDAISLGAAVAGWLAVVNLILALFNLLPGAPLDGGRLARALLWRWRGDKLQATRWSTGLGQLLGYGLMAIGLVRTLTGDIGGLWFVLLGVFLSTAAGAERRASELSEALRGTRVGDVMTRDPLRVPASLTVDTFVGAVLEGGGSTTWLTTGAGGVTTGMLSHDQVRNVRGDDRRYRRVGDLATPIEQVPLAYAHELVLEVLARLEGASPRAIVPAIGATGGIARDDIGSGLGGPAGADIVGIVTPEGVADAIRTGQLRSRSQDPRTASGDATRSAGRVLP